jgi:hypothetical protein
MVALIVIALLVFVLIPPGSEHFRIGQLVMLALVGIGLVLMYLHAFHSL